MKEEKIMAAAIGFLMIIVIVALLLKGKMSPIVVLAIVPTISALIPGVCSYRHSGIYCRWH